MSVRRRLRPGNRNLLIDHAAASPKAVFKGTAIAAVSTVRRIAATASGSVRAAK